MSSTERDQTLESLLNELNHLQSATDITGKTARATTGKKAKSKAPAPPISQSLDALLSNLHELREKITVDDKKKDIEERQKEVYASLARMGKLLDKVCSRFGVQCNGSPGEDDCNAPISDRSFNVAHTFMEESCMDTPPTNHNQFVDMHRILTALSHNDFEPALTWCASNRKFLTERQSTLEFALHPIQRLLTSVLFAAPGLAGSPYADLVQGPDAASLFAREYCARLGLGEQVPMKVAIDIGGSGALARIEKGRKIIKDARTGWSTANELPIEIPLLPQHRYHSVFICPVSREQASEANPAMMLECGHVVAKESLGKLTKGTANRVKCPYCPIESDPSRALQVHF
ncbi:CTLH/CRA C-terminal LisH motif domain [Rhizoctonia solani]|uniref:GID complex catalytic subunit 2 n=1 Tax=Rhizoctonia solani TaxID=456999 RepID=A0A8H7M7S6_9AGAM|nr:CTLH/CRA C-terminal LisH motif domain [Rhizoctonia solani]